MQCILLINKCQIFNRAICDKIIRYRKIDGKLMQKLYVTAIIKIHAKFEK